MRRQPPAPPRPPAPPTTGDRPWGRGPGWEPRAVPAEPSRPGPLGFLRQVLAELRRVAWPQQDATAWRVWVVVVFLLLVGAALLAADAVFAGVVGELLG